MKFTVGRQGKPVTVTVKSFGEDMTFDLRPLSALEVDEIRSAYPPPLAPRRDVDGTTVVEDKDPQYQRELTRWVEQFFSLKVCRMIGPQAFETTDSLEQVAALRGSFTETEFVALVGEANRISTGEITQQLMEAAKERLTPTESAAQEIATKA